MRPPRYPLDVPIQIFWGSLSFEARVSNVSAGGLFIETAMPLWIGATFSAELMLQPALLVNCRVSRIEPDRGMGVEVSFPTDPSEQRYTSLIGDLARQTVETHT